MVREVIQEGLEFIYHEGETYAIILRHSFTSESVCFFTPDSFSQQLGYLPHQRGDTIKAHRHKLHKRDIIHTQEVLFIKKGRVKVNLYDKKNTYIGSEEIQTGDIILLCGGGHGFEITEDTLMIEVKQGPYIGVDDKERFE